MAGEGRIAVGWVSRVHGLRGELEVRLNWSQSEAIRRRAELLLTAGGGPPKRYTVEAVRRTPKGFLVRLDGLLDRSSAEALKGAIVEVERDQLPALEEGEYYLEDLVGATVAEPSGERLGTVEAVFTYPSVDAVSVRLGEGGLAELPLLDDVVLRVDTGAGLVVIRDPEALIEAEPRRPPREKKR